MIYFYLLEGYHFQDSFNYAILIAAKITQNAVNELLQLTIYMAAEQKLSHPPSTQSA